MRLRWKKHPKETGLRAMVAGPRGSDYTDGTKTYATVHAHSPRHTGKQGWWWHSGASGSPHNRSDLVGLTEEQAKAQAQEYVKAQLAKQESER